MAECDMAAVPEKSAISAERGMRGSAGLIIVSLAVLMIACDKRWVVSLDHGTAALPDDAIAHALLTSDGDDSYVYEGSGPELRVSAPSTNSSSNLRNLFWPASAPSATDGGSCSTWAGETDDTYIQQGTALRVQTDADGKVMRAVTVTKNIAYGVIWVFNVTLWDTSSRSPRTGVAQVNLKAIVAGKPFPWHLCARAIGTAVTLKVWAGDEPEPEWGDLSHGGSATLPSEWVYPGKAGWYIGHLPPGGFASFSNLETWP
jgi:hypothetical protein